MTDLQKYLQRSVFLGQGSANKLHTQSLRASLVIAFLGNTCITEDAAAAAIISELFEGNSGLHCI